MYNQLYINVQKKYRHIGMREAKLKVGSIKDTWRAFVKSRKLDNRASRVKTQRFSGTDPESRSLYFLYSPAIYFWISGRV